MNLSSLETISRRAERTCVLGPHPPSLIAPLHAPAPAMSLPLLWSLPRGLTNLAPALEALWWPLAPKNAHVVCPLLASEPKRGWLDDILIELILHKIIHIHKKIYIQVFKYTFATRGHCNVLNFFFYPFCQNFHWGMWVLGYGVFEHPLRRTSHRRGKRWWERWRHA